MVPHWQEITTVRNTLVAALVACADRPLKPKARRFLLGLSSDELQFIAGYLGACILQSDAGRTQTLAERISRIPRRQAGQSAADRELKMILVREYLRRAGVQEMQAPLRAGHAVN
jgi:hypothetical protein